MDQNGKTAVIDKLSSMIMDTGKYYCNVPILIGDILELAEDETDREELLRLWGDCGYGEALQEIEQTRSKNAQSLFAFLAQTFEDD